MEIILEQDRLDQLQLIAERVYIVLALSAIKRKLNEDEIYLLQHAADVVTQNVRTAQPLQAEGALPG